MNRKCSWFCLSSQPMRLSANTVIKKSQWKFRPFWNGHACIILFYFNRLFLCAVYITGKILLYFTFYKITSSEVLHFFLQYK